MVRIHPTMPSIETNPKALGQEHHNRPRDPAQTPFIIPPPPFV